MVDMAGKVQFSKGDDKPRFTLPNLGYRDYMPSPQLRTCSQAARDRKFGQFEGRIDVEFLEDGRLVKLLEDVVYFDPCREKWIASKGAVVDGTSIPQWAWSFIGGPFEGKYRDASVIHDVACDERTRPWPLVHEAFYFAMRARGVSDLKAKVMYAAVYYFGPRWSDPQTRLAATAPNLSRDEFEELRIAIEASESRAGYEVARPITLEDIEGWGAS